MRMFSKLCVAAGLVGLVAAHAFGADHLIMTEFCVTPTAGEFIEIYNPTANTISLEDYYLTDATYAGGNTYYYWLPDYYAGGLNDPGGGTFADFYARFPGGAEIAPGEYLTICMSGSDGFIGEYGVVPDYELWEDGLEPDTIPDMLEAFEGSIAGQGGLTNAGEVIVFLYWDGEYDLVYDVDYVVWGDKAEAVDKTGIEVDGPDADTIPTPYLPDTPIASQTVVNADDDADEDPHDAGMTAQRAGTGEGPETLAGGNGITGHDETSEDMTVAGGSWKLNQPATPGYGPALYSVVLDPYQTIVPRTGTLDFHQTIANISTEAVNLWQRFTGVMAPNDTVYTSNPVLYQLGAGESVEENFALKVPGGAPITDFTLYSTIATAGPVIEDEDSFDLTVVSLP